MVCLMIEPSSVYTELVRYFMESFYGILWNHRKRQHIAWCSTFKSCEKDDNINDYSVDYIISVSVVFE